MPGGGLAVGGGGLGIVGLLAFLLINYLSGGGIGPLGNLDGQASQGQPLSACRSGAQANQREDCAILADINSVQTYWSGKVRGYEPAQTVFFTGSTNTGCGAATTDVGPFYCPVDKHVYIDLGFFDELQSRFGAQGGTFAESYVIAHEYGHHVQDLLGSLTNTGEQGASGRSVRTELQADCYAGVWANHAEQTGYIVGLNKSDIAQALDAAAAVGDDRIQSETQGQVNPETWTHGSSAERQHWFSVGWKTGRPQACDTFHARL
jgi:predicted metalloprotease